MFSPHCVRPISEIEQERMHVSTFCRWLSMLRRPRFLCNFTRNVDIVLSFPSLVCLFLFTSLTLSSPLLKSWKQWFSWYFNSGFEPFPPLQSCFFPFKNKWTNKPDPSEADTLNSWVWGMTWPNNEYIDSSSWDGIVWNVLWPGYTT